MLGEALHGSLLNVVPFWSAELLHFLQLGNEYGVIVTTVFTYLVRTWLASLDDSTWLAILGIALLGLICGKAGWLNGVGHLFSSVFGILGAPTSASGGRTVRARRGAKYSVVFEGVELYGASGSVVFQHGKEMQALTHLVTEQWKEHTMTTANGQTLILPITDLLIHHRNARNDKETLLESILDPNTDDDCVRYFLQISRAASTNLCLPSSPAVYDQDGMLIDDLSSSTTTATSFSSAAARPLNQLTLGGAVAGGESSGFELGNGGSSLGGGSGSGNNLRFTTHRQSQQPSRFTVRYTLSIFVRPKPFLFFFGGSKRTKTTKQLMTEMRAFLQELVDKNEQPVEDEKSQLYLRGTDDTANNQVSFPDSMLALDAWIASHYPSLPYRYVTLAKTETNAQRYSEITGPQLPSSSPNSSSSVDNSKEKDPSKGSPDSKMIVSLHLPDLSSVISLKLDDGVDFVARRDDCGIEYRLSSKNTETDCRDWLKSKMLWHNQQEETMFKRMIRIRGTISKNHFHDLQTEYRFPIPVWALSWYVDTVLELQSALSPVETDARTGEFLGKYPYMIDNDKWIKLDEDLFLKTKCVEMNDGFRVPECKVEYILLSNEKDLKTFVNETTEKFEKWLKVKQEEKEGGKGSTKRKLWYFRYIGTDMGGHPQFEKKILSEQGTDRECFMTFDHLFHEHKERIMKTLQRLEDVEYYRKNGLNRKAGFTFYGPAGTAKTATALASALFSKRHLIDVQLSIVKTNEEFYRLMHLKEIQGVPISDSNCMYLFDEIDIGMKAIFEEEKQDVPNPESEAAAAMISETISDAINEVGQEIKMAMATSSSSTSKRGYLASSNNTGGFCLPSAASKRNSEASMNSKLTKATLLTLLDPASPRHGSFWIACTNNIQNLPDAFLREFRMPKLHFGELKKEDALSIIRKYFITNGLSKEEELTEELKAMVPDRQWIPTQLISLCNQYHETMKIDAFIRVFASNVKSS